MEIFPIAITLHRHHARARFSVEFYTKVVQQLCPVKSLHEEIISVENPNLGHFCEILPFSTGNKWVTKPIFQSDSITIVWQMYRGKEFVLNVIGNEALLPSYCQLKTHFLPFWIEMGLPLRSHCLAIGNPMATQWHPSGCKLAQHTTNWVNWRGAIIFHKITYTIINM